MHVLYFIAWLCKMEMSDIFLASLCYLAQIEDLKLLTSFRILSAHANLLLTVDEHGILSICEEFDLIT